MLSPDIRLSFLRLWVSDLDDVRATNAHVQAVGVGGRPHKTHLLLAQRPLRVRQVGEPRSAPRHALVHLRGGRRSQ